MQYAIIFAFILITFTPIHGSITINVDEVVQQINDSPDNAWQADTYGELFSSEEKMRKKLGRLYEDEVFSDKLTSHYQVSANSDSDTKKALPLNYDIRQRYPRCKSPKVIWDQADCASGYLIASLSAISDRFCIQSNGTINLFLSPQHILSCDKDNDGCMGGYISDALQYMKKNGTITGGNYESDEGCQPYELYPCGYPHKLACPAYDAIYRRPKCKHFKCTNEHYYKYEKKLYKITDWKRLNRDNEEEIQREIYNNGSLIAGVYIPKDFFFYKKGIYKTRASRFVGSHVVKLIGWGEENGVKYWLAVNSWGDDWGENGYFRVARKVSGCYIESNLNAPLPLLT